MMSHSSNHTAREYLTLKPSRKRKELEGAFEGLKKKSTLLNACQKSTGTDNKVETVAVDNHLLAGYLAHEFLNRGTLFGQKWDRAGAEAVPLSARNSEKKVAADAAASAAAQEPIGKHPCYDDVARLLKTGRVHIPGIVNPTELGQWLFQM